MTFCTDLKFLKKCAVFSLRVLCAFVVIFFLVIFKILKQKGATNFKLQFLKLILGPTWTPTCNVQGSQLTAHSS